MTKKSRIRLDGKKFYNSFLYNFKGQTATKRCLCIPIDDNNFFVSEKTGSVYIDLMMIERSSVSQYGDTHFIRLDVPSDTYQNMTEEQRRAIPIVGNLKPIEDDQSSTQYAAPTPGSAIPAGTADGQSGDLPF